jgi:23S rRNA (uracil1939-C5)-methyltransferase
VSGAPVTLAIDRLGHRGDGVATQDGREVFVAFALPGETVAAEFLSAERGRLIEVRQPSATRVASVCPLFTRCGGCATQHLALAAQLAWKRDRVIEALAQRGIATDVDPCLDAHGAGRRRVTLHARGAGRETAVGFMAARSHDLVAVDSCPILAPALAAAPRVALALARSLASPKPLDIQITATGGGLDVDIRGHGRPSERERAALLALGGRLDLARLSIHGDLIAAWREPSIAMGAARVVPPAGGFLQATEAGEQAMGRLALQHLAGARHVADLFAGCGALALRIAASARVRAVEIDPAAIDALSRAARATPALKPVAPEARDLFRRPLLPDELDLHDAVVFDPPRAGAEAQARALAGTRKVRTVVAVSCNAATFARDARLLLDGGWRLERVTPLDQFRHSAHVEIVACFRR